VERRYKSLVISLLREPHMKLKRKDSKKNEVVEASPVSPKNHVYVIPPNRDLSIMHGTLQLLEPSMPRGIRMPIDFFFRHLAEDQKEKSIAVILSGMGTDGTLGLKAIKEKKITGAMEKIFALLQAQTGNDFSLYKSNTVRRRIERRMGVHQISNISQYVRYLQDNPHEMVFGRTWGSSSVRR
jgi:hypothetical protein